MSAIRGKDTRPEILIRRGLHAQGFRYRLHDLQLPGRPDMVFAKYRAVIFVNGCFWHGHNCALFRWPKTRDEFWRDKIGGNIERDRRNVEAVTNAGWRLAIVWECALKGPGRLAQAEVIDQLDKWLNGSSGFCTIRGAV